ncbi:hypothetical protein CK203_044988 [Vitis vinifera]|uniref:Uncharacterized protein n=1 Tax=Vitis vinifera TaxID=29760 RepID=A0A438HFS3_VITVI|nr:hypothetical protein CK203_044988 [Vitis vinifera]
MVETSQDWLKKPVLHYGHTVPLFTPLQELHLLSGVWVWRLFFANLDKDGFIDSTLEQPIYEIEWAQARFDQPNLLDERRLRVVDHVRPIRERWLVPLENG